MSESRRKAPTVEQTVAATFRRALTVEAEQHGVLLSNNFLDWISKDVGRRYSRMLDGEIYVLVAAYQEDRFNKGRTPLAVPHEHEHEHEEKGKEVGR